MQADSPHKHGARQDGIVDAAQFAESMVPEGLHGTALSRNPSQTSLSGAAPGGVLDTGPDSTALPRSSSHSALPPTTSSDPLHDEAQARALPGNASSGSLAGAGPNSALVADRGQDLRAQGSSCAWPWQAVRPGGAVRQSQPSKQSHAPVTHLYINQAAAAEGGSVPERGTPAQLGFNQLPASVRLNNEVALEHQACGESEPNQATCVACLVSVVTVLLTRLMLTRRLV